MADLLFCPTRRNQGTLEREDVLGHTKVVGSTLVDVIDTKPMAKTKHCLITLHRPELVDDVTTLSRVTEAIGEWLRLHDLRGVFPVHPRTRGSLDTSGLQSIDLTDPQSPKTTWSLIKQSPYVFTDSGGIQEEACILGTKCFTLRPNTERQETTQLGANVLISPRRDVEALVRSFDLAKWRDNWEHPYGSKVAQKIVEHTAFLYGKS